MFMVYNIVMTEYSLRMCRIKMDLMIMHLFSMHLVKFSSRLIHIYTLYNYVHAIVDCDESDLMIIVNIIIIIIVYITRAHVNRYKCKRAAHNNA